MKSISQFENEGCLIHDLSALRGGTVGGGPGSGGNPDD